MSIKLLSGAHAPNKLEGLYLLSYARGAAAVWRVEALQDDVVLKCHAKADATCLSIVAEDGQLDCCFDGPDRLRVRGRGIGLRLTPTAMAIPYWLGDDCLRLHVMAHNRMYAVIRRSGRLDGDAVVAAYHASTHSIVNVLPDAGGDWEIAIEEYDTSWIYPTGLRDFETCLKHERGLFDAWRDSMLPVPKEYGAARDLAAYLLWSCTQNPKGFMTRPAVLMSRNWMCSVWSWDNCFNAQALVTGHAELAWDQLRLFIDHQDAHGALPDSVQPMNIRWAFVKPPVWGWTVAAMLERAPESISAEALLPIYEALLKQAQWWLDQRCMPNDVLPHYYAGCDSGWDNATVFDHGVPVMTPDLGAYLAVQAGVIADLARRLDRPTDAEHWQQQADALVEALLKELWNGERFVARHAVTRETVATESLIYCMPILLGKRLPEDVRKALIKRLREFVTDWGLASEHPDSPRYEPDGYWRGPIWGSATLLIVDGLIACGEEAMARDITERFCRLCAREGFAENFDAKAGKSQKDPGYTWTASSFMVLASRLV